MWPFEDLRGQDSHLITLLGSGSGPRRTDIFHSQRWIRAKTTTRCMERDHKPGRSLVVCCHHVIDYWHKSKKSEFLVWLLFQGLTLLIVEYEMLYIHLCFTSPGFPWWLYSPNLWISHSQSRVLWLKMQSKKGRLPGANSRLAMLKLECVIKPHLSCVLHL